MNDVFLFLGGLAALIVAAAVIVRRAGTRLNRQPSPDASPDRPLHLGNLAAHLDEYVAADAELAAGFDRLRQAIRDEQNGDQP